MRPMKSRPASVGGGSSTATSPSRISFSRTIHVVPWLCDALNGVHRQYMNSLSRDVHRANHAKVTNGKAGSGDRLAELVGLREALRRQPTGIGAIAAPIRQFLRRRAEFAA